MNINKARKNLLAHFHLLPEPVQADVQFLLEKLDATVRELNELKRNAASWNKIEDLPHEIWRDIAGYEGIYQVSNMGRVKSFYGIGENLLTPSSNKSGYMYVVLTKDGVRKSCKVHTLVARAFISNPENKPVVHHKDSNRSNNRVENLQWVTHQENTAYAVQKGSYRSRSHEFGSNALARKFGVCKNTILNVVGHITYENVD